MTNKFIVIAVTSILISSCGGSANHKKVSEPDSILTENSMPTLQLETVDFSGNVDVSKVKAECSMLEKLSSSILDSAKKYNANIVSNKTPEKQSPEDYILKTTYVDVFPHRWIFLSIRPSSSATVKAEIIQNGQVILSTSKAISSGVAFGACDRLEKIAVAGGRYIAKWSTKQVYE